jgi:hypothetical protein
MPPDHALLFLSSSGCLSEDDAEDAAESDRMESALWCPSDRWPQIVVAHPSPQHLKATPTELLASPSELSASPSELLASSSELLASPTELLASPSELSASPSELLASPSESS